MNEAFARWKYSHNQYLFQETRLQELFQQAVSIDVVTNVFVSKRFCSAEGAGKVRRFAFFPLPLETHRSNDRFAGVLTASQQASDLQYIGSPYSFCGIGNRAHVSRSEVYPSSDPSSATRPSFHRVRQTLDTTSAKSPRICSGSFSGRQ